MVLLLSVVVVVVAAAAVIVLFHIDVIICLFRVGGVGVVVVTVFVLYCCSCCMLFSLWLELHHDMGQLQRLQSCLCRCSLTSV